MVTIIDVTKAWDGTASVVLGGVLETLPEAERIDIRVRAYPQQYPEIEPTIEPAGVTFVPVAQGTPEHVQANEIGVEVSTACGAGFNVHVYSFSPLIRQMATAVWALQHPDRVSFSPLAPFGRHYAEQAAPGTWDATFMSEDDAADVVVRAVASTSLPSVPKTDLRTLLQAQDQRFRKDAGGFAAAPRFITLLIDLAVRRGLLETKGDHPATVVALTDAGRQAVGGHPRPHAPDGLPLETSHAHVANEHGASRSGQFIDSWRAATLGPFMTIRTAVYRQIATAVAAEPQELQTLVSNAVRAVRQERLGEMPEKFPWSRVRPFIETLMQRRPVALCDGQPVSLGWGNGRLLVDAMAEGWELMLDGELVLHLIDEGIKLTINDLPDLAGALYGGRDGDEPDIAYSIVDRLVQDGVLSAIDATTPLARRPVALPDLANADAADFAVPATAADILAALPEPAEGRQAQA